MAFIAIAASLVRSLRRAPNLDALAATVGS
jgi:hypothetical protein